MAPSTHQPPAPGAVSHTTSDQGPSRDGVSQINLIDGYVRISRLGLTHALLPTGSCAGDSRRTPPLFWNWNSTIHRSDFIIRGYSACVGLAPPSPMTRRWLSGEDFFPPLGRLCHLHCSMYLISRDKCPRPSHQMPLDFCHWTSLGLVLPSVSGALRLAGIREFFPPP